MARHRNRVKVYSQNVNVLRHIGSSEAFAMLNAEPPEAVRLSKAAGASLVIQLVELGKEGAGDACAITWRDIQTNAGEAGIRRPGGTASFGNHVDRTMFKVEQWPVVGDTLAPRVRPRSPNE